LNLFSKKFPAVAFTPKRSKVYCPAAVFAARDDRRSGVPAPVFVTVAPAVAVPVLVKVEVVRVVEVTLATLPVPVEASHDATVPFEKRRVLFAPIAVSPVPPFAIGSAVPEYVIASVPDATAGLVRYAY
jgi:hypothetical protein